MAGEHVAVGQLSMIDVVELLLMAVLDVLRESG